MAYSREDSAVVDSVCGRLERAGYDVWRDTKSIPGGAGWRDKIGQAISEVDYVLLLLSFNVIKKPHYQQAEVDLADAHQKTIIPLFMDAVPMPPKGFEVILSGVEYIPLHNSFEDGIGQLLADLGEDAGKRKRRARERARDALTEARDAARLNKLGKKAKNARLSGLASRSRRSVRPWPRRWNGIETGKQPPKLSRPKRNTCTARKQSLSDFAS